MKLLCINLFTSTTSPTICWDNAVNSQSVKTEKSQGDFDGQLSSALCFRLILLSVMCVCELLI